MMENPQSANEFEVEESNHGKAEPFSNLYKDIQEFDRDTEMKNICSDGKRENGGFSLKEKIQDCTTFYCMCKNWAQNFGKI